MGSSKETKVVSSSTTHKKEKTSKKVKVTALEEVEGVVPDTTTPGAEPKKEKKEKREKKEKKRKSEALAEEVAPTIDESVIPVSKPKKEKPSKKRKAESLTEAEVSVSETLSPEQEDAPAPADLEMVDGEEPENPPSKKRKVIDAEEIEVDVTAPEPPSKKALRALKKGKPLPPSKSGAENTPEPEEKRQKKTEVEKRSEHGIWIGNMAFHTSKEDLKTFLVEKSDLTGDMITRIHMPGPNDNKSANRVPTNRGRVDHNKGFAYVDFSTAQGVAYALELSEELLSGRRVLIKDNKSFEGRPDKTKEEQRKEGKPPSKRVFVGNLSFDVTEESLTEHFFKCGPVESIKIATFEDSGKCKGYGWIVFEELSAAESAVRGYVMVEEEPSEASDDSDSDSDAEVKPPKKGKMRKWWINKIKGRPLKLEFAEDAQVRYKKRYGKDGTKNPNSVNPNSRDDNPQPRKERVKEAPAAKVVEYRTDYAPRLTGGIVESKGAKTKF